MGDFQCFSLSFSPPVFSIEYVIFFFIIHKLIKTKNIHDKPILNSVQHFTDLWYIQNRKP